MQMNRQPPPSYVAFVKDVATQLLNPTATYANTRDARHAKKIVVIPKKKK